MSKPAPGHYLYVITEGERRGEIVRIASLCGDAIAFVTGPEGGRVTVVDRPALTEVGCVTQAQWSDLDICREGVRRTAEHVISTTPERNPS